MNDLRNELAQLVFGYWDQPSFSQRVDLVRINELRTQLGFSPVDEKLKPIANTASIPCNGNAGCISEKETKRIDKHAQARWIYSAYLAKLEALKPHQEYAQKIAKATHGGSMTPVEPLATMGCGNGPLLCDICHRPMILEGGNFHGVYADVAWTRQSPVNRINWKSYIKGGMVVEIQSNGTLRIYHGYARGKPTDCCNIASRQDDDNFNSFDRRPLFAHAKMITEFVCDEFPQLNDKDQQIKVNEILNLMFGYDPGIGVNQPTEES